MSTEIHANLLVARQLLRSSDYDSARHTLKRISHGDMAAIAKSLFHDSGRGAFAGIMMQIWDILGTEESFAAPRVAIGLIDSLTALYEQGRSWRNQDEIDEQRAKLEEDEDDAQRAADENAESERSHGR